MRYKVLAHLRDQARDRHLFDDELVNRPLERLYAIVFFDALRVKLRSKGVGQNQAVYLALGVDRRQLLPEQIPDDVSAAKRQAPVACCIHLQ